MSVGERLRYACRSQFGDEPHPPCSVGNITIEKLTNSPRLAKGLSGHDELASLLGNFQRYSSGTDRPFWLEAYSGTLTPMTV